MAENRKCMYWYDSLLTELLNVRQRNPYPDKTNTFVAQESFALRNKSH